MSESVNAQAVRLVPCARCGARIRQPCVSASGNRASDPHAVRVAPILEGWRDGYGEGLRTMIEAAERHTQRTGASATAQGVVDYLRRHL